jgi:hypothetical protein
LQKHLNKAVAVLDKPLIGFWSSALIWRFGLAVFALFLLMGLVSAQQVPTQQVPAQPDSRDSNTRLVSTRSIQGRVLTNSGAPVPGAVVLLKDGKTLQVRSYIAQKNGEYHFFGLSTDVNYALRAENQGMTSKQKTVSVFDSHQRVKLDLKLSRQIQQPKK